MGVEGRSFAGCDTLPVFRRARGTKKRRPAMQKITTVRRGARNFFKGQLTIGLDLGDRSSSYCVLDEAGEILLEQKLPTTPEAMKQTFGRRLRSRIAMETGTHSPWVSRVLTELGHEVIGAHAQKGRWSVRSRRQGRHVTAEPRR